MYNCHTRTAFWEIAYRQLTEHTLPIDWIAHVDYLERKYQTEHIS